MPKHALLSASSSHRWLACPPSAKLCANQPDTSSPYAQQGTDAHELAAFKVLRLLGKDAEDPTENLTYFDSEMDQYTDDYAAFVLEQVEEAKRCCRDPIVYVEQRLDYSRWVPEGFGTGDACVVADGILTVVDLKYGAGIPVDAEQNPQLMCYSLGLLDQFDGIYDVSTVRMSIFQPRRDNISTFEMPKSDLLDWAETVLVPAAKLAYNGEGEFQAGDHCQFCKAKADCRKRAEYNLEMARYDLEMPATLEDSEIAAILPRLDEFAAWAGDVKEFALQKALSGTKFPGFKVVEGRSVRKYTDESAVAQTVAEAGYDPYEKKLLGITAMTQALGRKKFDELLGGLICKPRGKPVLVADSDKRPEMDTLDDAFSDN